MVKYANYDITQSVDGVVQRTFDAQTGKSVAHVDQIAGRLVGLLPPSGPLSLLDVGTGNGDFIRSVETLRLEIAVDALEVSKRYRDRLVSSGMVRHFYLHRSDVVGPNDMVSALHVLEHVPDPSTFLSDLALLFTDNGSVIVKVPNVAVAVSDLLVFDHRLHFTLRSLADVAKQAGLVMVELEESVGRREITMVLRRDSAVSSRLPHERQDEVRP